MVNIIRWAPKSTTKQDILSIIEDYGLNNDWLVEERDKVNTEKWIITLIANTVDEYEESDEKTNI